MEYLHGCFAWVLMLVKLGAGTQSDHRLSEDMFVAAVNGMATAPA